MALTEVRHVLRDALVWASWTLLKGTPFHGKSYGELRRLSAIDVTKHVLVMLVALSGVVWLAVFMPSFMHGMYVGMLFMFAFSALVLLFSTFTLTWLLDRWMTYI